MLAPNHLFHPFKERRHGVVESRASNAFDILKKSMKSASVLILPDASKPFHVVCGASDFAFGFAFMQFDNEGLNDSWVTSRDR